MQFGRPMFYWEGPTVVKMVLDSRIFASGGMRDAYKAQVVNVGGVLSLTKPYVMKKHKPEVVQPWLASYASEQETRAKLCEKVCQSKVLLSSTTLARLPVKRLCLNGL